MAERRGCRLRRQPGSCKVSKHPAPALEPTARLLIFGFTLIGLSHGLLTKHDYNLNWQPSAQAASWQSPMFWSGAMSYTFPSSSTTPEHEKFKLSHKAFPRYTKVKQTTTYFPIFLVVSGDLQTLTPSFFCASHDENTSKQTYPNPRIWQTSDLAPRLE